MLTEFTTVSNVSVIKLENDTCRKIPFSDEWRTLFDTATSIGVILALTSLLGNIFTIVQTRINKVLHTPTYTAILCLAISDSIAVVLRFIKFRANYLYALVFHCIDQKAKVFDAFVGIFAFASLNASCYHLVMLSAMRYYIVAHPLKSYSVVTSRRIVVYSIFCWTCSGVIGAIYGLKVAMNTGFIGKAMSTKTSLIIEIACVFYLLAITLIPCLTLHVMKIRKMHTYMTVRHRQERKMHTMMVAISVTTVVCLTAVLAFCLHFYVDGHEPFYLSNVAQSLFFVNHAAHPIFYFLFSGVSRNSRCRKRENGSFDSSSGSRLQSTRLRTFHREES
ncbi:melanocyte-stimulating hormone receptor-like [Ostrea edulis]|uniref:melanocyte-stimulating hormone receptor-like n=1 Tax=Ostrea edulis TaxID=37623 RepID=UPI0020953593|nr:melanocyte-stimulating hormone receptor-like [Ostrea edulis]